MPFGLLFGALLFVVPTVASAWTPFVVNGRCKKSRNYCRSTVGNAGGAGACCDPADADIETCVKDDECIGTYRYRWATSKLPIRWFFAPNGMAGSQGYDGITVKQLEDQTKLAFATWSKPACTSFRESYQGQTKTPPSSRDGLITIFLPTPQEWAQLGGSGALAFATPYSDSLGNIVNADIYVSPNPGRNRWGVPPVPSQNYDYFHTMVHEIGHTLGLGHSFSSANIMYYSSTGTGPDKNDLSPDDIDGICALYPATNTCQNIDQCAPCYQCLSGTCTAPTYDNSVNCKPCKTDADCGSKAACVDAPEGKRCLLKCFGDCCPSGYQCKTLGTQQLCVPYTSHCPLLQCVNNDNCGADSTCVSNICEAPTGKIDYTQCAKSCTQDSECKSSYECVTYGTGKQQCTLPCPNFMCPLGYSCRLTQKGQHCIPHNPDYCSCRRDSDCTTGKKCEEDRRNCTPGLGCDKRCISVNGGEVGEPCNPRESTSCAAGLRCENIAVGYRCVQECATQSCPSGFVCVGGGVNLCMKEKSRGNAQSCDGLFLRCNDGLQCLNVNDGGTFCVETCDVNSACTLGGHCGLDTTPPFCQCTTNQECSPGFACTSLVGGASACQCKNPPCQTPCGNGICETNNGENCDTCAKDCGCQDGFTCNEGFCKPKTVCGNGVCEADLGENCGDCPKDCSCGFGAVCFKGKCETPFCGDGQCDPDRSEDCERCPDDCGCTAPARCLAGACTTDNCGDGKCDAATENCSNCAKDCACPTGQACHQNKCVSSGSCGDGVCDTNEDCVSCKADCGCKDRKVCDKGTCVSADVFCPAAQQTLSCEAGDRNCTVTCKPGGCGCQQAPNSQMPIWLMLLLCGWLLRIAQRGRRRVR